MHIKSIHHHNNQRNEHKTKRYHPKDFFYNSKYFWQRFGKTFSHISLKNINSGLHWRYSSKNLPANAGDMGLFAGPQRFHMSWRN